MAHLASLPPFDLQQRTALSYGSLQTFTSAPLIAPPHGESLLVKAIYERIIACRPPEDRHRVSRKILIAVALTSSAAASASFIQISLRLPAGPAFAAANFLAFSKLDMWAIRSIIDRVWGPKSEHEYLLIERASPGRCYLASVCTVSTLLALISQIPVALPALEYDGKIKYPATISLFLGGAILPFSSFFDFVDEFARLRFRTISNNEKALEQVRSALVSAITEYADQFRGMGLNEKLTLIEQLKQLQQGEEEEQTEALIKTIISAPEAPPLSRGRSILKNCSQVLGGCIATSFQAWLAFYTFSATKEYVLRNDLFSGVSAGLAVAVGAYLPTRTIINTAEKISFFSLNLLTGQRQKSIAEQLRPKTVLALQLLSLVIDLGALGATTVIWGDLFDKQVEARISSEVNLCLAYFLFLYASSLDLVDEVVALTIRHKGSSSEQEIVQLQAQLQRLQSLIQKSDLADLISFTRLLSTETKEQLLRRADLTASRFNECVESLPV